MCEAAVLTEHFPDSSHNIPSKRVTVISKMKQSVTVKWSTYHVGCSFKDENSAYVLSFDAGIVNDTTESFHTAFITSLLIWLL